MQYLKRTTSWYFTRTSLPYWGILILDCLLVVFGAILAVWIDRGTGYVSTEFGALCRSVCIYLLCFLIGFRIFHTYAGVLRFSTFKDLLRIFMAVIVSMLLIVVVQLPLSGNPLFLTLNLRELVIFTLTVAVMLVVLRIWVKTIYEDFLHRNVRHKAFILGIQSGGVSIAKNINTSATAPYTVAGFVTIDPSMVHHMLMGQEIYLLDDTLINHMRRRGASYLIISPLMMEEIQSRSETIDKLVDAGIKLMVIPGAQEWDGKSDLQIQNLKPVTVEDLLPREKIEVDMKAAQQLLQGSTVMITGAAGSIGSEMVRQVAAYAPANLVLIDQAETPMHDIRLMMKNSWPGIKAETIVANICDKRIMESLFSKYKPDYVFHAAAYKHVPMMEDNPYESIINNVLGTKVIADLAVKYGTRKFVMVSTDKAVNPTNVMGCSKRICEIYVQALDQAIKEGKVKGDTRFVTTRFGNVLGSNGSVIPLFQKQIEQGGPITVTHPNIIRFFMLIPEACKLVIEAGTMGGGGEIFVFDMGEPVKIADLARRMIKLSGAKDVEIVFTGLRDGEKLYEEVLNDQEITLPTFHPKIKIAKVRQYTFAEVEKDIESLIDSCATLDAMTIVGAMKGIVPEYKSAHSVYEKLDKKEK